MLGVCLVCAWGVLGVCLGCAWGVLGRAWGVLGVTGVCLALAWGVFGACLTCLRCVYPQAAPSLSKASAKPVQPIDAPY